MEVDGRRGSQIAEEDRIQKKLLRPLIHQLNTQHSTPNTPLKPETFSIRILVKIT